MSMRQVSYYLMVTAILFSPLAFGAVETWSLMIMELLIAAAAFFYSIHAILDKKPFFSVPGAFPLILLCEFILFQIIPLPASIVKILSPASWELYNNTAGLFNDSQFMTISVNKTATISEFLRIFSCSIFYIFSVQLLSDKDSIKSTVKTISLFGALLSFSSICQLFLRKDYALWFRYVPENAMIVGPYICHNHYAGLMEMIFPFALALFIYHRPSMAYGSLREKIFDSFENPAMITSVKYLFFAILIAVSVFLSLSRGGIISLVAGTVFFLIFYTDKKPGKKPGLLKTGILAILVISGVTWFGWEDIASRFSDIKNIEIEGNGYSRLSIWKDTIPLIKKFIITGSGFGSFESIFPSFLTFHGPRMVDHAHNDYLEFAATGGIVSFLLIFFFLFSVIKAARINYHKRRDRLPILIYAASMSGIISILIHSIFDFNMQIPANMLYFALLCALLVAGSAVRMKNADGTKQTLLEHGKPFSAWILLITSIAIFFMAFAFHGSILYAEKIFSEIRQTSVDEKTDKKILESLYTTALKAHLTNPFESDYSFACAKLRVLAGDYEKTAFYFEKALSSNPSDAEIMSRAAKFFILEGKMDKAEKMMNSSIKNYITGFDEHKALAEYLFNNGRKDESMQILSRIFSFYNGDMKKFIIYVDSRFKPDYDNLVSIMPERSACWKSIGEFFYTQKDTERAEKAFMKSISCDDASASSFISAASFFTGVSQHDKAIHVLKKAGEKFPDNTVIMEKTATIYESLGVSYRAMEEFRKILIIDPGNKKARKGLGINK